MVLIHHHESVPKHQLIDLLLLLTYFYLSQSQNDVRHQKEGISPPTKVLNSETKFNTICNSPENQLSPATFVCNWYFTFYIWNFVAIIYGVNSILVVHFVLNYLVRVTRVVYNYCPLKHAHCKLHSRMG